MFKKLMHAGRFSVRPMFSLFHVSPTGNYTLLERADGPGGALLIAERWARECWRDTTWALEIRCDGRPVQL